MQIIHRWRVDAARVLKYGRIPRRGVGFGQDCQTSPPTRAPLLVCIAAKSRLVGVRASLIFRQLAIIKRKARRKREKQREVGVEFVFGSSM